MAMELNSDIFASFDGRQGALARSPGLKLLPAKRLLGAGHQSLFCQDGNDGHPVAGRLLQWHTSLHPLPSAMCELKILPGHCQNGRLHSDPDSDLPIHSDPLPELRGRDQGLTVRGAERCGEEQAGGGGGGMHHDPDGKRSAGFMQGSGVSAWR